MKQLFSLLIFFMVINYCHGQTQVHSKDSVLGRWTVVKLEHFNSKGKLDKESTDHFSRMIVGRKLHFKDDGTVDISGYTNCYWFMENNYLSIRYSGSGEWDREKIIQLNDTILVVRDEVDFPSDGNTQVIEYKRVSQ